MPTDSGDSVFRHVLLRYTLGQLKRSREPRRAPVCIPWSVARWLLPYRKPAHGHLPDASRDARKHARYRKATRVADSRNTAAKATHRRRGVEAAACEDYRTIEHEYARLLS